MTDYGREFEEAMRDIGRSFVPAERARRWRRRFFYALLLDAVLSVLFLLAVSR
jgi:hypothetical protein